MRPAGAVRQALITAAHELSTPDRSPTIQELAERACVGHAAALHTVRNLRRCGELAIARTRKVEYRNRPVAEYAPPAAPEIDAPFVDLNDVFASWAR